VHVPSKATRPGISPRRAAEVRSALAEISTLALCPAPAGAQPDPFASAYHEHCSICHGEDFRGAAQGTPRVGVALKHGDSVEDIGRSIAAGFPETPGLCFFNDSQRAQAMTPAEAALYAAASAASGQGVSLTSFEPFFPADDSSLAAGRAALMALQAASSSSEELTQ